MNAKKHLWLLSTFMPLVGGLGLWLALQTSHWFWIWLPLLIIYLLVPALDWLFPTDLANPNEADVPALEADPYYRWVLYLMLPMHFMVWFFVLFHLVNTAMPLWSQLVLLYTLGLFGGLAVNLGHELGHKKRPLDRWLAKLALASTAYGHFNVEHNAGHHRHVATPEDSASACWGESIYQFARREVPGGLVRAWRIEAHRLQRLGHGSLSIHNQILHSYLMSAALYTGLVLWLGPMVLFWVLLHIPFGWWQLTSANYVEHYGLLRQKKANGQYEPCQPKHSWNSNHLASNLLLFQLQRHSDHHANPTRSYQSLRHFDEAPQLPMGYMGMFLLAYCPPLWSKVMDRKVLSWADHDLNKVNQGH